jgi:hypothetical protein
MSRQRFVMSLSVGTLSVVALVASAHSDDEYDNAMTSMQNYATQVTEANDRLVTVYTAGLSSFETTLQHASPEETNPQIMSVILKSALKTTRDMILKAVGKKIAVDLQPLADLSDAINVAIDQATVASTSHKAGEWINTLRSSIVDNGLGKNSGALLDQLKAHYAALPGDEKFDWITDVQFVTEALKASTTLRTGTVEQALYESWINGSFNHCSLDGGEGFVKITFDSTDALEEAVVKAPLGDKIEGGLGRVHSGSLMELTVNKQVCSHGDLVVGTGWRCVCFDDRNQLLMDSSLVNSDKLLTMAQNVSTFKHN